MEKVWKALIIDDERLARARLRALLEEFPHIFIEGEAASAEEAARLIRETEPDVLFLDIQMPRESGFDLLERVETDARVIFVTAYDEYAIRAFEVNALDYLLKPVNPERLRRAVGRLSAPLEKNEERLEAGDYLFLNTGRRSRFVRVSSIKCITAADVYSEILFDDGGADAPPPLLLLKSLGDWEQKLPAKMFARIHRSTIINLDFVERVEKRFNQPPRVFLRGTPEPFAISRRYAAKLKDRLG